MNSCEELGEIYKLVDPDVFELAVLQELIITYDLYNAPNKIDCSDDIIYPDKELCDAFVRVIEHYSTTKQFQEFKRARGL